MKIIVSIAIYVLTMFTLHGQISSVTEEFALPASLNESSGVIYFNNKLITHNDSGNENKLYEVDITSGLVTRTITISNATNTDWEDITQDDTSIYIADIGNNSGDRNDLKIYKISKSDYNNSNSVTAELIEISYADQLNLIPNLNANEWDAEALVSFNATNLMLFNKNWVDGNTKAYLVSKIPGAYALTTLNSGGLITGGTYNPLTAKLFLIGYTYNYPVSILQPFVWESENFSTNDVFSGTNTQTFLSVLALEQAEAITYVNANTYYVTSESFSETAFDITLSDYAKLVSFSTNDVALSVSNTNKMPEVALFPNPVTNYLQIKGEAITKVEVFDVRLSKLFQENSFKINMSSLNSGLYFVKIHFNNQTSVIKKVIKK